MRSPIVQNEVAQLVNLYIAKGENLEDAFNSADKYLDEKLKDGPLVVLFHEMKKEIAIRRTEL
jgi:autonomous glycyl radical cofactor GrcA